MAHNTPRGTPARVLIIFAMLSGVVVVSALRDSRRPDAGRISYPTAVGDASFYIPGSGPLQVAVNGSVFSLHGEPAERLHRRDDRMFRVPLAVPLPRLYTTTNEIPGNELPPLYLKTAHGEYVKVELRRGATMENETVESLAR